MVGWVIMGHVGLTDRQLLEVIYDRTERFDKTLYGNGQPGLVDDVSKIDNRLSGVELKTRLIIWLGGIGTVSLLGAVSRLWIR